MCKETIQIRSIARDSGIFILGSGENLGFMGLSEGSELVGVGFGIGAISGAERDGPAFRRSKMTKGGRYGDLYLESFFCSSLSVNLLQSGHF